MAILSRMGSRAVAAAACICLCAAVFAHDDPLGSRFCECLTTATPPAIDGRLDDPGWQTARPLGPFVVCIGPMGDPARHQTRAAVLCDQTNLYLGIECFEPHMDQLVANARDSAAGLFADDCLEVFIDTRHDHQTYFHFATNVNGARYAACGYNDAWTCQWQAAGSRGPQSWRVEMAIPLAALGGAPAAAVWGFNVNREHRAGGDTELSGWSLVRGAFHRPQEFGHLVSGSLFPQLGRADLPMVGRYAALTMAAEVRLVQLRQEMARLVASNPAAAAWQPKVTNLDAELTALQKRYGARDRLDLTEWLDLYNAIQRLADAYSASHWDLQFHLLLADY